VLATYRTNREVPNIDSLDQVKAEERENDFEKIHLDNAGLDDHDVACCFSTNIPQAIL